MQPDSTTARAPAISLKIGESVSGTVVRRVDLDDKFRPGQTYPLLILRLPDDREGALFCGRATLRNPVHEHDVVADDWISVTYDAGPDVSRKYHTYTVHVIKAEQPERTWSDRA